MLCVNFVARCLEFLLDYYSSLFLVLADPFHRLRKEIVNQNWCFVVSLKSA